MSKLVLVTGASGFLASHIIYQLIEQGYRVRGTAREKKVGPLRELYKGHPSVEIVPVSDLITGDFTDAVKDVDVLIHTATAMPGKDADPETTLKTAIEGSLNVLREAERHGVKKVIVTGSVGAIFGDTTVKDNEFRAEHWSPFTKEDIYESPLLAYQISKKYAELAIWEWAETHPHVDVTTILPPYLYGPFSPLTQPIAVGDWAPFSTNMYISKLISPSGTYPLVPVYLDVRDAAKAHVEAIKASPNPQRKRIIISSPHVLSFADLKELLKKENPEISHRLTQTAVPDYQLKRFGVDYERIEEVLGIKKEDFIPLEQTFLEAISSVLEVEKLWKRQGYEFTEVPAVDF